MKSALVLIAVWVGLLVDPALGREGNIMVPRVPVDKIEEAQALVSPPT